MQLTLFEYEDGDNEEQSTQDWLDEILARLYSREKRKFTVPMCRVCKTHHGYGVECVKPDERYL